LLISHVSQLEERSRELVRAKRYAPPVRGWIRAVREALGTSTAQLAKRPGIRQLSLRETRNVETKRRHGLKPRLQSVQQ
jgi:hypothetical protein